MADYLFIEQNGRTIPLEDKIFGISRLAKECEAKSERKLLLTRRSVHFSTTKGN